MITKIISFLFPSKIGCITQSILNDLKIENAKFWHISGNSLSARTLFTFNDPKGTGTRGYTIVYSQYGITLCAIKTQTENGDIEYLIPPSFDFSKSESKAIDAALITLEAYKNAAVQVALEKKLKKENDFILAQAFPECFPKS